MSAELTIRPLTDASPSVETALKARAGRVRDTPDAAQKFEAFVLQTFIQEMMPKEAEGVFGSGVAGDFWRSMMAEKMAEQVAERGELGIADLVRAGGAAPARTPASVSLDVLNHLSKLDAAAFASPDDEPKSGA
ncbi:rod-binding protein [Hyphomicrobium sp.]|uniref:rod-binding protein n=1 Tax=Hyphomicrobium sp. TaxID=82 RepID=UPI002C955C57|nr:rod-binding protein [Hyphomicrobium sp.]HRN88920.1 rod-binding protein [Hyphomicrobium sp.]HRQ27022.1 rod-binding protein [Hyphomicrobium sp.]